MLKHGKFFVTQELVEGNNLGMDEIDFANSELKKIQNNAYHKNSNSRPVLYAYKFNTVEKAFEFLWCDSKKKITTVERQMLINNKYILF